MASVHLQTVCQGPHCQLQNIQSAGMGVRSPTDRATRKLHLLISLSIVFSYRSEILRIQTFSVRLQIAQALLQFGWQGVNYLGMGLHIMACNRLQSFSVSEAIMNTESKLRLEGGGMGPSGHGDTCTAVRGLPWPRAVGTGVCVWSPQSLLGQRIRGVRVQ